MKELRIVEGLCNDRQRCEVGSNEYRMYGQPLDLKGGEVHFRINPFVMWTILRVARHVPGAECL